MTSEDRLERIPLNGFNVYFCLPPALPLHERTACVEFLHRALHCSDQDCDAVLACIPSTQEPSCAGICILDALLSARNLPVLALHRAYAKAYKSLPEDVKAARPSPTLDLVNHVSTQISAASSSMATLLPQLDTPALRATTGAGFLSHQRLHDFANSFSIPGVSPGARSIVAIAAPSGHLLALSIIAVASHHTAFPLSATSGRDQFLADLQQSGATYLLMTEKEHRRLELGRHDYLCPHIFILQPEQDQTFSLHQPRPSLTQHDSRFCPGVTAQHRANNTDYALMLFTSGTSGTKKIVPITSTALIAGVSFVIESWGLTETDVCLNMMPLYHVGGIVRNLLAPIFAGGSTICCTAFDANSFWDIVEEHQPTWYYASPTMHQMILDASLYRRDAIEKSRFRLIANAAGGLLPSLAQYLRHTFDCVVLPSYGMTECMPVSSPPLSYQLERSGTSGTSAGPELSILDSLDTQVRHGMVGRIAVRGPPVFDGYIMANGKLDRRPFTTSGWFDTGDLGYIDQDGYLYITGRSKEVINRGGELISPFEVEEAVLLAAQTAGSAIWGRVSAVLAFSVPHDVLQEVVGIAVVTPPGARRIDIKSAQHAVKSSLAQPKWPQVVVFMDALPKNNSKIQRINFSSRMDMQQCSDAVMPVDRHYEASCPPANSSITERIRANPLLPHLDLLSLIVSEITGPDCDIYIKSSAIDGYPQAFIAGSVNVDGSREEAAASILEQAIQRLDDLNRPSIVHLLENELPLDELGEVDDDALDEMLDTPILDSPLMSPLRRSPTEVSIAKLFAEVLGCNTAKVSGSSDFFDLGGDSMKAGRLLSCLRRVSSARVPIDVLFTHSSVSTLAQYIDQKSPTGVQCTVKEVAQGEDTVFSETRSSTSVGILLFQLIPLVVIYPMKRGFMWSVFLYAMALCHSWPTTNFVFGRLINLLLSLAFGRIVTSIVSPVLGIAFKWLVVGTYREGLYPMWGMHHSRWWITQKVLAITGRGVFGVSGSGLNLYYRLLGARIGSGVTISPSAQLGEYDLLDIEDGADLDKCICRPFAVEKNTTMYLGRIHIGSNASVGLNAIVAPGTAVPENVCIGPNSSSWELEDADESNRNLSSSKIPGAHFLLDILIAYPLGLFVGLARALPWLGGLYEIVRLVPRGNSDALYAVLVWFAHHHRIAYHYLAVVLYFVFGPMTWFIAALLVKKLIDLIFGRMQPGPLATRSQIRKLQTSILTRVVAPGPFHKLIELFGTHYDMTSVLYRAFGARVGQRVYWPGTGPAVQNIDMLEIGNDVVFGSRSHLVTSDGVGTERIVVGSGSMIADRVVLLPGTTVERNVVLGSGALSRRNQIYSADTVWVGARGGEAVQLAGGRSKRLQLQESREDQIKGASNRVPLPSQRLLSIRLDGNAVSTVLEDAAPEVKSEALETATTSTPFGRAFYERKAPYDVLGLPIINSYSILIVAFTALYWTVATTSAIQILGAIFPVIFSFSPTGPSASQAATDEQAVLYIFRPLVVYALITSLISIIMTIMAVIALALVIGAKWMLLGRRQPGNYDWDKSSYCQRWQLFLTVEKLRRHSYGGAGILSLLTGTHWMVLYFRLLGAKIGKDCALFANGNPSCLLTEPDLVTLGDRVAVDDASLVGHINSRGVFDLNELRIGDGAVLRSGSRLLSGARMGAGSVLMEHTLVMAGDEVDAGTTMQGWPSAQWSGRRMPTMDAQGAVVLAADSRKSSKAESKSDDGVSPKEPPSAS